MLQKSTPVRADIGPFFNPVFTMDYPVVNLAHSLTGNIVNAENISALKIEALTKHTNVKYLL